MFGSEFITIVELGAKLVNGMLGRVGLDRVAVIGPAWSDFVRRNVDQDVRKYKVLVGNVPLENSRSILEMYLYGDEWWKMMKELDLEPGHLFAFTLLPRGLFHLIVFNESGETVTVSETYSSYVLRNAFFYLGRKPAG
nr:hypothetical protein [Tanacetum cinerariifolium]